MNKTLVREYRRLCRKHKDAVRRRMAKACAGAEPRVFAGGVKEELKKGLLNVSLSDMCKNESEAEFRRWFDERASELSEHIRPARSKQENFRIGHALKILSLYIYEVVMNVDCLSASERKRLRPWLYVPLDGDIIECLKNCGEDLDFSAICGISLDKFHDVQCRLRKAAVKAECHRILFEDNWGKRE